MIALLKRLHGSIRIKIFVPILLVLILATGAATGLMRQRMVNWMEENARLNLEAIAQSISFALEGMTTPLQARSFLTLAASDPDIELLMLVDAESQRMLIANQPQLDGRSLGDLDEEWSPQVMDALSQGRELQGPAILLRIDDAPLLAQALVPEGNSLWLLQTRDPHRLQVLVRDISNSFLKARFMVLAALSTFLVVFLHILVIRPLKLALQNVNEHKDGVVARHEHTFSEDEIGILAGTVHETLNNLVYERDRLRLISTRSPVVVYRCLDDQDWTMLSLSDAIESMSGMPAERFLSQDIAYNDVIHPADREYVRVSIEAAMAENRDWEIEYRVRHCDEGWHHVREIGRASQEMLHGYRVLDGVIYDITERREHEALQRKLEERQKLHAESLRTMAGNVAHHFNNLLTAQHGLIDLLALDLGNPARLREGIGQLQDLTERLSELSRQMLLYVGESDATFEVINLRTLLDDVRRELAPAVDHALRASWVELEGCPQVEGNRSLLLNLLLQLLRNAAEAGEDQVIHVSAGCKRFREQDVALAQNAFAPAGRGNAFIEVADSGCGMSSEVLERAFDPFFTTKSTGRGLGLSVVLGIARVHGAMIALQSSPNEGTRVTCIFPAENEGPAHLAASGNHQAP